MLGESKKPKISPIRLVLFALCWPIYYPSQRTYRVDSSIKKYMYSKTFLYTQNYSKDTNDGNYAKQVNDNQFPDIMLSKLITDFQ